MLHTLLLFTTLLCADLLYLVFCKFNNSDLVCRMIGMRQQENEAFRRDLEEAASSKAELANQLSDARAEAGSWQHQLAEARQVQDSLKDRLRLERTLKQKVEQEVEVRLLG